MPLYVLGLMGATRRMDHYDNPAWQPLFVVAAIGAVIIFCGIMLQLAQVVVSVAQRERARDLSGDPWGGRTLEWATSSPPPAYNFARIPVVRDRDAFWDMKQRGVDMKAAVYRPIHMPRNTATGFVIGRIHRPGGVRDDLAHLVARDRRLRRRNGVPDPSRL